jgi:hypothetical protein
MGAAVVLAVVPLHLVAVVVLRAASTAVVAVVVQLITLLISPLTVLAEQ